MGTHPRVLKESYPMNTNRTGFKYFPKTLHLCAFNEIGLSIGRVNSITLLAYRAYMHSQKCANRGSTIRG